MNLVEKIASAGIRALSSFVKEKQEAPPSRPIEGMYRSGAREDYSVSDIVKKLTPAKLASAMKQADEGDTYSQYEIFEKIEQDPHVQSVWAKRRRKVTGKALQIIPAIEEDGLAQKAADLCQELVLGREGEDGIDNWHEGLWDLTDAIGKGFALSQIVWMQDSGRWMPQRLERWPQRECQIGDPSKIFQQDQDTVRVITDASRVRGEDLQPYQWILHVQKAWSAPLARAALFRAITWFYLFKHFDLRDWAIFCEKFGMPIRLGKYHSGASDNDKAELWSAVLSLGKDAACMIPDQSTIELVETQKGSRGTLPYPGLVDHCNDEISKCIMGSTMSVEQGEKGARSLGEVYERAESDQLEADCRNLAATIRRDLLTPIVGFNLGWDVPVPKCSFLIEDIEDLNMRSERDDRLVKLGLPVAKSYFYEKYGIPEPEEGEELLEKAAPPPSPFAPSSALTELLALAEVKKKSVDWVISRMSSRERSKDQ